MPEDQHTHFRALAARANFLAADRPGGIMFAAEEICRFMSTDWEGCVRVRKCLIVGSHNIKGWSSTQVSVALSSGEAEYYGVVRALA